MADSRPLPGPCTRTCTRFTPAVSASRAHCSAATVAANGVLFLEPLNPALPLDPHAMVLPRGSVIVTVVLLNVALTCATLPPRRPASTSSLWPYVTWLPSSCGDRATRSSWCARWCEYAGHGRAATTMTDAAIGRCPQSLDVHRDLGPKALRRGTPSRSPPRELCTSASVRSRIRRAARSRLFDDLQCGRAPDAEDVSQTDLDLLVTREIDARIRAISDQP